MYLQGLVLLLCILYSSVFIFGKLTLEYAPPLFVTGARMILAGALLLGYQFFFRRKHFILDKHHLMPILIVGVVGVYLTNALEFWGLQFLSAGKACFLYSFAPIAMALFSYAWFSEKITLQKGLGLMVGILGFIPLLVEPNLVEDRTGMFFLFSYAELAMLGAAVATSIGWLAMREVLKNRGYSAVMANATSMIVGGIVAFAHSFAVEPWDPTPIRDFWPFLEWFLCLTLVSNLISYNLHARLLRSFTATYISFSSLGQPFFAALLGWLFLNEDLSEWFWISLGIVTLGLYIYYQGELKKNAPLS